MSKFASMAAKSVGMKYCTEKCKFMGKELLESCLLAYPSPGGWLMKSLTHKYALLSKLLEYNMEIQIFDDPPHCLIVSSFFAFSCCGSRTSEGSIALCAIRQSVVETAVTMEW